MLKKRRLTFPDFKTYYKPTIIKEYVTGTQQKNRSMEENKEAINKSSYDHMIFNKGTKTIQQKKDNLLIKWC